MADDKTSKKSSAKPAETAQPKRRILRPAAEPTTLREQSELAQAKSSRPRKRSRTGRILSAPFRFIGSLFRPLGRFKFFRAIGYVFAPPYFRNSWKELRQVTWPDARQTRRLVFAVILFSLVFGSIVAVVDFGLDKLFCAIILNH